MTTDPTLDLCCMHGAKLDRAVELLEDIQAVRKRGQDEAIEQWKQEFLARHGLEDLVEEQAEEYEPLVGFVGYLVPPGTDSCPHCGDRNFNEADRVCISCNHDHPEHGPLDCEQFCRNRN